MKKSINKHRLSFLDYLSDVRGYSDLTLKSYDESLQEAFEYIDIYTENSVTVFELMPYRVFLKDLKSTTKSKKLSAVRSFVNYLNDNKLMRVVLKSDDSIKVSKTLPKPIKHELIVEALQKASLQESVVVVLLYTLGLRISELSNIKLEDISSEWIRVVGKGSKTRDVPLLKDVKELVEKYIESYGVKKFLFEKDGEKLSENSLRYMVNKVFDKIAVKVTPHQLRHSYATSLLNGGAPISDVSELLGHKSLSTTQIYTKLGSALIRKNYNNAHPLCGVGK